MIFNPNQWIAYPSDVRQSITKEHKRARAEVSQLIVVPSGDVTADVVTMNSVVRLRDLESGETEEFELVYPEDANMAENRISVLAPIGTAIHGCRIGDVIEWPVPAGIQRFRVEEMLYQPERPGAVTVE